MEHARMIQGSLVKHKTGYTLRFTDEEPMRNYCASGGQRG